MVAPPLLQPVVPPVVLAAYQVALALVALGLAVASLALLEV